MRVISRKFTYDDFMSRVPGVVPSLKNFWVIPSFYNCNSNSEDDIFYDYDNAVRRASEYNINASEIEYNADFVDIYSNLDDNENGNYGLVVSDVIIPNSDEFSGVTDYTDLYVNLLKENGDFYDMSFPESDSDPHYEYIDGRFRIISGGTEIKVLKYSTLVKWYTFFRDYYRLINDPENIRSYTSATEYAKVERKTNLKPYNEMDELFAARGGETMYEWIVENCIIQFDIPSTYTYEWKTTFLYYPQAVKWAKWFKERDKKYYSDEENGYVTKEDMTTEEFCKTTENCCDCNEFFRLGGHDFYMELKTWLESLGNKDFSFATNSASLVIPINIQTTIDDLGEMAILSSEWESDVDYHNTLTDLNGSKGGTVVYLPYKTNENTGEQTYIEDTVMIKNGVKHTGFKYNRFYETVYEENYWENYTPYYVTTNQEEFASSAITSYTYSPVDGKLIYNPTEITTYVTPFFQKMAYINGKIYKVVENGKYVEMCYRDPAIASVKYKDNSKLPIVSEDGLEYVLLNKKKYYVELDEFDDEVVYFFKNYVCKDEGCKVTSNVSYIMYDNILYETTGDYVSIPTEEQPNVYRLVDGFFTYKNKTFLLRSNGSGYDIVVPYSVNYSDNSENGDYFVTNIIYDFNFVTDEQYDSLGLIKMEVDGNKIKLYHKFTVNTCTRITGYTDSKLELLRRTEITSDDMGNELPGHFKDVFDPNTIESDYNDYNDETLFGEGEAVYNSPYDECTLDILYRVGEVSNLRENNYVTDKEGGITHFTGNIIESIEFYYTDRLGNRVNLDENGTRYFAMDDNAIPKIESCQRARDNYSGDTILRNFMMCDIVYYMGAVIKVDGNKYIINDKYHTGVKYTDTFAVFKKTGKYYMDSETFFTFTYYYLSPDNQNIDSSAYKITNDTCMSKFEVEPMLFYYNESASNMSGIVSNLDKFSRWEDPFNFMVGPTYRSEFNLAASTPQTVEANIYIDRGISSAFERHLKLQEFRTMEALENYGNNWFKIIN